MKRLDEKQKKLIKQLTMKSCSINKISNELKTSKSVVYYCYKKFFGKRLKEIQINDKLEEDIGEIVGAFAGDGNFYLDKNYRYRIRFSFSGNEIKYAKNISETFKKIYEKPCRIYNYQNVTIVDIYGKKISDHIKSFLTWDKNKTSTVRLTKSPSFHSLDFLKGFCRGLFDSDGWTTKNNLMISCISVRLMKNLSESLKMHGISHLNTKWKGKDEINPRIAIFLDKINTIKYFKIIGTSNPKRKILLPMGISG